jgi:hypothetical protein
MIAVYLLLIFFVVTVLLEKLFINMNLPTTRNLYKLDEIKSHRLNFILSLLLTYGVSFYFIFLYHSKYHGLFQFNYFFFIGTSTLPMLIPTFVILKWLIELKKKNSAISIHFGLSVFFSVNLILLTFFLIGLRNLHFNYCMNPYDGILASIIFIFLIWIIYFTTKGIKIALSKMKEKRNKTTLSEVKRGKELLELGIITQDEFDKIIKAYREDNLVN